MVVVDDVDVALHAWSENASGHEGRKRAASFVIFLTRNSSGSLSVAWSRAQWVSMYVGALASQIVEL